jgi:DNA-binding XRE family transcriptional regulator
MAKSRVPSAEQLLGWREIVGVFLKSRRTSLCMTQDDVAYWTGWARTSIVAIEKGRQSISLDQLMTLAALYRCHVIDLLPMKLDDSGQQRY